MNKIFKLIAKFAISMAAVTAHAGAKITLPANPRFGVEDYLTFFLRKIPMDQYALSDTVKVTGDLQVDLSLLDEPLRGEVGQALRCVVAGERPFGGFTGNFSEARVEFLGIGLRQELDLLMRSSGIDWTTALDTSIVGPSSHFPRYTHEELKKIWENFRKQALKENPDLIRRIESQPLLLMPLKVPVRELLGPLAGYEEPEGRKLQVEQFTESWKNMAEKQRADLVDRIEKESPCETALLKKIGE